MCKLESYAPMTASEQDVYAMSVKACQWTGAMAIPDKQFDDKLMKNLREIARHNTLSLDEYLALIIMVVLELHNGNRTHTAKELRIPIRTFRLKLKMIESMGYELIPAKNGMPKLSQTTLR